MKTNICVLLFLSFLLFCGSSINAQVPIWSNHIGSSKLDVGFGTTDKNDNYYIGGYFYGQTCWFTNQELYRDGISSIFLAKYDPQGNEQWLKQLDSYPIGDDGLQNIKVDKYGFIYITGKYEYRIIFGSDTLTEDGSGNMYLAKLAPDGTCIWAKQAGGDAPDFGIGLAIDSNSNVFVCGVNMGTCFFDNISIEPGGFLAKYDSNGLCLWAKKIVTNNFQYGLADVAFSCMAVVNDKLFLCGTEHAPYFTVDTTYFNHPGLGGHILCCYDLSGNNKWIKEAVSPGGYSAYQIAFDGNADVFITGRFYDSITFGNTVLRTVSAKQYDCFIAKYSSSGNLLWAKQLYATLDGQGRAITSDESGNFYVTGNFNGSAVFGSDTVISDTPSDFFLARYSSEGECYGAFHFGNAEGKQVSLDSEGSPIIAGTFINEITIGGVTMSAYGDRDIFILKNDAINGVKEKTLKKDQLVIYANPNEGKCNIDFPEEFINERQLTLTIFNNQGKVIQTVPIENREGKISINIQAEAKGIYNVLLTNGKKNYSGKIVFR